MRNEKGDAGRQVAACIALLVLFTALVRVIPARAHANLETAEPATGAVLAESPPAVVLDFSETLDVAASSVELHRSGAGLVVEGPGVIDPAASRRLTLALPPLEDGTYSAVWQVRSAVDGHITEGVVIFSVGENALPPRIIAPPGTPEPATTWPTPLDAVTRWLNFLSAALLVGSLLFGWLVWRPAWRRMGDVDTAGDWAATRLLQRLAFAAAVAWAIVTLLFVLVQGGRLDPDAPLNGARLILSGRTGMLVLARYGLLLSLGVLVWRLPAAGGGRWWPWALLSLVGAAALLTISLQSHSAALPDGRATAGILLDWLHLLAMSAWIGGLLPLALLLRRGRAAALVPAFTRVALPSVAALALTGLASSLFIVRTVEALLATSHGRSLVFKLALFALLFGFGALNVLFITPRLRRDEDRGARLIGRSVRAELLIGLVLLLAVGVMTAIAPAFDALQAQRRLGFQETASQDDVRMTLRVAPVLIGDNEFAVDIRDEREGAARVPPEVLLRFNSDNREVSEFQVDAPAVGNGRFLARGAYLSAPGAWQIEVILRLNGFNDVRHIFELDVDAEGHGHETGN